MTRFYLLLLTVCIIIASIYTSNNLQTQVYTIKNPSKATFNQLYSSQRYSPTLDCPCQNLTMPYNVFVRISPRFHQICSSDYVISIDQWIEFFSHFMFNDSYDYEDFRRFIVPQFRGLASLCTIAQVTVADALSNFMSSTLISRRVESSDTIQLQITSVVEQLRFSTNEAFIMLFSYVRNIAKSNRLISSTMSNWYISDFSVETSLSGYISPLPRAYDNDTCFCDSNPMCSSPALIDGWPVPGFRVGCYPIESLLQSTLECLYNLTCINMIQSNNSLSDRVFRALDPNLSSENATIQYLVDNLMIDQWETNITYENYYKACAPLNCIYSLNSRFDRIYVVTTIMGLSGGFTVVLKLLAPFVVKIGRYILIFRRQHVQPLVTTIT